MRLKKLLLIISIVVISMFSLMLATSYAWYSFENGRTTFSTVTTDDVIEVSYQSGEYISTNIAVPITDVQIDKYSDKSNFNIRVKNNVKSNEVMVAVKLTDVTIANELKNSNFVVDLYYRGELLNTITGTNISTGTDLALDNVILEDDLSNQFEIRVYILDNGEEQNTMMNKTFSAKISVDVVSRLKTELNDYSDPDIYVSSISIDGVASDNLPTSGFYSMTSTCTKGSVLTWEPLGKTITYESGSYVQDECSLAFTSSTDYPLLSEMPVGSYVKYTGTNGCDGTHCDGDNANYVNDDNMGYCYNADYKFVTNGWRIGYVENGSAHLVSAGAPECVATYVDGKNSNLSTQNLEGNYYYGSGYNFDDATGKFNLTGTIKKVSWSDSSYQSIIDNTPYTCLSTDSANATCSTLYEISNYSSSTEGEVFIHYRYEYNKNVPLHLANLNNKALRYCNDKYAKGGVCDDSTVWAMNAGDFEKIVDKALSVSSCYGSYSDKSCGYNNDLIDIGSYYWFGSSYGPSIYTYIWNPSRRFVNADISSNSIGLRPVINIDSAVKVVGGSGTMKEPYVIG